MKKSENYNKIYNFFINELGLSVYQFANSDEDYDYLLDNDKIFKFLDERTLRLLKRRNELTDLWNKEQLPYSTYSKSCNNENLPTYKTIFNETCEKQGFGFELVEAVGGSDQGSLWYKVYYFKDLNIYLKIEGSYYSYSGVDIPGTFEEAVYEVKPVEKVVIVYDAI